MEILRKGCINLKNCVFLTQKGGCGKSTLCNELVYSLTRSKIPMAYIDLDQQGAVIKPFEDDGAVVSCIDTPGALSQHTAEWIAEADTIVIPTKASAHDMPVLQRMIDAVLVNAKEAVNAFIVVNMFNRWSNCANFLSWVTEQVDGTGIEVCTVSQAEAFPKASSYGVSVVEMEPRSKAAKETKALMNRIRASLGIDPED